MFCPKHPHTGLVCSRVLWTKGITYCTMAKIEKQVQSLTHGLILTLFRTLPLNQAVIC